MDVSIQCTRPFIANAKKLNYPPMCGLLLLILFTGCSSNQSSGHRQNPTSSEVTHQELHFSEIRVPQVHFNNQKLSICLEELSESISKLTHQRYGSFVMTHSTGADSAITYTAKNQHLSEVLDILCQQSGFRWNLDDGRVLLSPVNPPSVSEGNRNIDPFAQEIP